MKVKLSKILGLAFGLALTSSTVAAKVFDFTDPKGVNHIRFNLDAPLEAIAGTGNGISGTIHFDPADPDSIRGRIVLTTESLTVPNSTMREHLHGANWLNAAENPEIVFEALSVEIMGHEDNVTTAHIEGMLTLNGVSREVTVPATFTYLPDRLSARSGGQMEGDILVVRSEFSVMRSDFNIRPGQNLDTVAEEIELSLALAGMAPE